jgi:iron complex outermembrane receptor protein
MDRKLISHLLTGAAFVAFPGCVYAQASSEQAAPQQTARETEREAENNGIADIVVTAQKRSESAQRIGIAISAFDAKTLQSQNVASAQDLQKITPGLRMESPGSPIQTTFTVRGVGQRDISDHNEAAVVLFSDGAYVSWLGAAGAALFDLERVEVLKGPQGTLFGRNATGGLINIITAKPTFKPEGYARLQVGSYAQVGAEAAISGPLTETLAARLSGYMNRHDGYFDNSGGPDMQGLQNYSVRGQLRWQPDDSLTVDLLARGNWLAPERSGGFNSKPIIIGADGALRSPTSQAEYAGFCQAVFPAAPLFGFTLAPPGSAENGNCFAATGSDRYKGEWRPATYQLNYQDVSLTINYGLGGGMTLTSISDYQHLYKRYDSSASSTNVPGLFDYYSQLSGDQYSQELRLAGSGDRFRWVLGGFYFHRDDAVNSYIDVINNPGVLATLGARYSVETESIAGFLQGEYDLGNHLTLILGGRYTHDRKSLDNAGYCVPNPAATGAVIPGLDQCQVLGFVFPASLQFNGFNGGFKDDSLSFKAQLDFKPTPDVLLYAGVNRGAKAGGFNSGGAAFYNVSATQYRPEQITAYEAGFKTTLLNRALRLNGAVFHYDYKDYQSYLSVQGSLQVFNVDAKVDGAELEIEAVPVSGLSVRAAVNYLDAKQKNVPFGAGSADFVMPNAPKWTLTGNIRYEWDMFGGRPALQASANHVTSRSTNAIDYPDLRLPAFTRVDLRAEYTTGDGKWTGAVFVDNVTDKSILLIRVPIETLTGGTSDTYDRPRWFGASLTRRF